VCDDVGEVSESMSNQWLESVARGTVHVYTEHILKIRELTEQSTKQLIVDIGMCVCATSRLSCLFTKCLVTLQYVVTHSPDCRIKYNYNI